MSLKNVFLEYLEAKRENQKTIDEQPDKTLLEDDNGVYWLKLDGEWLALNPLYGEQISPDDGPFIVIIGQMSPLSEVD